MCMKYMGMTRMHHIAAIRLIFVTGEQIADGSREMIEKKKKWIIKSFQQRICKTSCGRTEALEVINKCEGLPNKELAKFADQINALCDKWSR